MRITHVGGPTALIEFGGWRLLTDPTFDPPGRDYRFGYGTGSRKTAGPALTANGLGRIDAVLLSHDQHGDNLDDAGRALLPSVEVVVTTERGAQRLGGGARGLAPGESTWLALRGLPPLEVTATPCRHGPPFSRPLVGDVIGFAVRPEGAEAATIWISGDTVLDRDLRRVAERLSVDVALLHMGGVRFGVTGPLRYTLTARDALELCELLKPRVAIPIHYEGWSHFRQGRAEAQRKFAAAPDEVRRFLRWLPIGEAVEVA